MLIDAFLLGAIQGLTEFLPVSSSAHLILIHIFYNTEKVLDSNTFDAVLHAGSLSAIIWYFRCEVSSLAKDKRALLGVSLSALPALAVGAAISPYKETVLRSPVICIITLSLFGVLMIVAEKMATGTKKLPDLNLIDYLKLGASQAVALIPGVSRSGITISSAMLLGIEKRNAFAISFLMAIPVTFAASVYKLKDALTPSNTIPATALIAGLASTFFFSMAALFFLDTVMKRFKFAYFAYYRFALSALVAGVLWLGM